MSDGTKTTSTNDRGKSPDHDVNGRFAPGNKASKGNPLIHRIAQWRATLADTISVDDVAAVIGALTGAAKKGEPWAVIEFLNRTLGKPSSYVDTEGGAMLTADFLRAQLQLMNASVKGEQDGTNEEDETWATKRIS